MKQLKKTVVGEAHENEWAVLSADHKKLLASSADLRALQREFGNEDVVYTKVLPPDRFFAFVC